MGGGKETVGVIARKLRFLLARREWLRVSNLTEEAWKQESILRE